MTPFNVLISSAGRRVALLQIFRETLEEMELEGEVLAADMSAMSSAYQLADRGFRVPRCTSDGFLPRMLQICEEQRVRLLVPTIDTELPAYARAKEDFAAIGTTIAISAPAVIDISGNKDATHEWLSAQGFPTVRQAKVAEVLEDPQRWPFPLLVKPRGGSASIGVGVVRDQAELRAATSDDDYVVQSLATGIEHTVSVYVDRQGRCRCAIPRRRLEVRAGEVSKGMTARVPAVVEQARTIAEALPGAYGALNIQMFWDEATGEINVIEINPRFGGGFPLAWQAGGKYPRWLIEEILGLPSSASDQWTDRLVMLRYDDAVFVDADDAGL